MQNLQDSLFPDVDLEIALLTKAQSASIDLFKLQNKPYKPSSKAEINMFKETYCGTCSKDPCKCDDYFALCSAVDGGINENIVIHDDRVYCTNHSYFSLPE